MYNNQYQILRTLFVIWFSWLDGMGGGWPSPSLPDTTLALMNRQTYLLESQKEFWIEVWKKM